MDFAAKQSRIIVAGLSLWKALRLLPEAIDPYAILIVLVLSYPGFSSLEVRDDSFSGISFSLTFPVF